MGQKIAYVGNWGFMCPEKRDFGITVCKYDQVSGELTEIGTCLKGNHVGCICINREKGVLYCVDEQMGMPELGGQIGGGRIFAVKIDPETGMLTELNHQPSFAPMPTYLSLNEDATALVLANHSGFGTAAASERDAFGNYHLKVVRSEVSTVLYPLAEDGSILPPCDIFKHQPKKTAAGELQPALHSVVKAPGENLYFVCDIGTSQIYTFRIEHGQLKVCNCYDAVMGSGPRYGCVHPEKPFYFYNHEKLEEVTALRYDKEGTLSLIGSVNVMPEGHEQRLKAEGSDLKLHPNGRYLYNISRRANVISVMEVDQESGQLSLVQAVHFEATDNGCRGARGCAVSEDGKYFFVCVADDKMVIRYELDQNGRLLEKAARMYMGSPANLTFL